MHGAAVWGLRRWAPGLLGDGFNVRNQQAAAAGIFHPESDVVNGTEPLTSTRKEKVMFYDDLRTVTAFAHFKQMQ